MDIGQAVAAIKEGKRVTRAGWNGKDMWIAYSPGYPHLAAESFWSPANKEYAESLPGAVAAVRPSMTLKTADGSIAMGWSPSGSDTLADDWMIVE